MSFNESALNIVSEINPMLANKYVTIDQCKDYVSNVTRNNYILMAACLLAIIVMFLIINKYEKEKKGGKPIQPLKFLKKLEEADEHGGGNIPESSHGNAANNNSACLPRSTNTSDDEKQSRPGTQL